MRFEPKARTAWHTHPLGQTLHVVSGVGRVQAWGGPIREIRPGDTVWIPPAEKHWNGAAPNTAMMHIARKSGMAIVTDSGESAARLELPPAGVTTITRELMADRVALFDYALKAQLTAARRLAASLRGEGGPE